MQPTLSYSHLNTNTLQELHVCGRLKLAAAAPPPHADLLIPSRPSENRGLDRKIAATPK